MGSSSSAAATYLQQYPLLAFLQFFAASKPAKPLAQATSQVWPTGHARVAIARSPRAPRRARCAEDFAQSPRAFRRLAERQGPGATRPRLAHHGSALIANALMFFKQRKNTRDSGQIWTAGLARGFKRCTRTLKRGARKRVCFQQIPESS